MNEKYLQDLYGWIKGKDASYESRYTYDAFKQKMQDPEYATTMHGWISSKDPSFSQKRPVDAFIQQVKVEGLQPAKATQVEQPVKAVPSKKKFASDSSSEDSSLASQQSKKVFATDKRLSNSLGQINTDLMNDTEENVVAKLSKDQNFKELGFSFEESGATGDYMTVTAPNGQTKEISLDNFLDSKSSAQSLELRNFINKNTTKERRANLEQVVNIEDTNSKIAQYDKQKFGQQFVQEGAKPIDKKNSKYLNDRLKTIDAKLINETEEFVVPQMNYQFGDLGFKFEKSGITGDYMVATAPNGKKMEISLDPFLNSKAVSESAKLQQFIKDNTPDKGLYVIEKAANEENKKYTTQKDVDASIKKVADDANNLNLSLKSFLAKKDKFDKLDKNNPEYMRIQSELILERESLMSKQEQIKTKEVLLKKSVGKYTEMKGQQGTWLEGTWNAINDASASITAGFTDMAIDVLAEVSPNEMQMSPKDLKEKSIGFSKKLGIKPPSEKQTYAQWKATLTEDQQDAVEDELDDITKKSMKKDVIPAIRKGNREVYGFSSTTPEWEQLQSEGFWGGAYFGLVKTAPALIGGAGPAGWAQRTAQMYSMVSDGLRQEMDQNPEFAKVSENEKLAVILPIGITGAVLEEFGLKNIKGSTGLINRIAMSALGKAGTTTTAKSFRELVENEVEGKLAKGLLTLTSAGLAEAESGSAQEATETGIKEIYNVIKGKEMFKTPDSIGELIGNVVKAGAQEAVGGFVLGMPTAVSSAYSQKGFLKMDDQNFRIFEAAANDENIQKAFITNLKTKITQGVMTTAEAKEELNNYRNSIGLFKSLPEGLNIQQKKEAMNLLKEKRDLQNQVDGKDPSLVVKLKERIGTIDASLVGISETAANDKAVAESNRQEFDDLPEAQKEKLKEEAGKKIMDMIGDRNDQDVELDEDTVNEVAFRDFVKQKETTNRIAEIQTALSTDAETQVTGREKRKLEKELSKLKETQDAIQEQTTDEGLLRSQQSEMGLQGVGEGNAQSQTTSSTETITNAKPQEQIDIDLTLPENKDNIIVSDSSNGFILIDSDTNQPIEVFNDNAGENSGISKPYATQEEAQARIEELKVQPTQEIDLGLNIAENPLRDVESTTNFLTEISDKNRDEWSEIYDKHKSVLEFFSGFKSLSEAYHKAKVDGSNPELVKIVEEIVSSKTQPTTQTQTNETTTTNEVQPERTGNGGTTRAAISKTTPLEGAPKTNGATGPDEQLVSVAEKYAAENGIDLKRQGEYVEVDEERAKRIADAYEEMENNPQDPRVKKAYAEMIRQTKAQYQALVDAGYKFWFIDLNNPDNIDYISSPYNAMRDLRQNKQMGVFPTEAGFGSDEDVDVSKNPLLEDTGIMWASGGLDGEMMPVTANDLFRAVHDAFGHGLEGSGFRARGEENAWQAHSRLYTGDAIGAMTSETRGQNSWVNFGPNGERNRTASAEDTKFAYQKVGLMPELTWTEGRASDMAAEGEVAENLAEENAPEEFGTQGLSEAELKGYDRMMDIVKGITEKVLGERGGTKERAFKAALDYLQQDSKVYEIASDVQREALVRQLRKQFGIREKSAPSPLKSDIYGGINRVISFVKDIAKVTMTERQARDKQIKDLNRGAKDAIKAWKTASQELSKEIKELRKSGKITVEQAGNVIRAFSSVNIFSPKSVSRFKDYMTKVFEKADYANKLSTAKEVRRQLKKLARNKDKNANLRDLASKFSKIDPSIVADIDKYNALAAQIKSATDGSKIRGQKIKWSEVVNIADATDYVNQEMEAQDKILKEERTTELEELFGEDAATINSLLDLDPDEDVPAEDVETVRDAIKRVFDTYANSIKSSVSSGVDSFTGEDVSFTKKEKETIGKFMAMDLDKMSDKNALQAVDALANFIENKSTAKMAATIATYTGDTNAELIVDKGIYAVPLKKLWSPQFGAFLAEQTTTLPMVFEKMFKGFNRGGTVMDAMGLTKLINRKAFAETQANNIVADYIKEFYNSKSKPNGQAFNTAYNNIERGTAAFMLRNVIGTEAEMQTEFDRRKGLVKESIDVLSEGNKLQQKKAELYQKAYDKIVADSENIQDIKDKTDPKNLEAVDFWHKQWESKFDQMSDVASGIYNKILDKDLNYSPDKFTKLKAGKTVDLLNSDSAFINNTNGVLYKNKTGVLEDATRPSKLPSENKKTTSYIDLSFDKNNSNSMYDALVDIETAEPIRQVQAFLNSNSYNKIIPDSDNADMLAKRIDTYVQNIRGKNPFSNDEFSKTMRALNKMATLGVGQALGGVTQPIKQVVPVALNTLINGQGLALSASFDADFMSWLNSTGYAIANRGVQSQGAIDSLNKMLDEAANSKGQKVFELIEKANAFMLKTFLEKPDVFIAKASWKTYYEKSLKKQGINPSDIDYSDHEVNEEAANYAQRMVDRQQNISDQDLAGNLFTDKNAKSQVLRNIFMPFASFRMNQASRLATDLSVLGHWSVSTAEDKKIALLSLSSFATEMAVFKLLSAGVGIALSGAAIGWLGKDETEEEKEKRKNNIYKGQVTGAITDVLSPLPVFDKLIQTGAATFLSGVQEGLDITEEDKLALFSSKPQDYLKNLGLYGMAADRLVELSKLIDLSVSGTYTDDYGKKKTISDEDKATLSTMIGPALLTNIGLGPSELAGVIRNSVKLAKKKGSSPEEVDAKQAKESMIQEEIDNARTADETEVATDALNRITNPKDYKDEKATLDGMKQPLLTNEETGITYDNISDVKKYDRDLWEKNFGPNSEYYKLSESKREAEKLIRDKIREAEEEKYGYVKKKRKGKNSDGTYKSSSSSSRRGFGGGSNSNSSSTSDSYGANGVRTTTTTTRERRGFN
jgi:hypothetical protein